MDTFSLKRRFFDPAVMSKWQNFFADESNWRDSYYVDVDNILRSKKTKEGVAYIGGNSQKASLGLEITNPLREYTSSFQYIYTQLLDPVVRQDGLLVQGTIEELLAVHNLEDWLEQASVTEETQRQLYSCLAQLYYALYLLGQEGWDGTPALLGIKIREVPREETVPFFDGHIKTFGIIPVIFELERIRELPDRLFRPEDVAIAYYLTLIQGSQHWNTSWDRFRREYEGYDLDIEDNWNNLWEMGIFGIGTATLTCIGRPCLGEMANGREDALILSYLPLPSSVQPYALALRGELEPSVAEEYLNRERMQEEYTSLSEQMDTLKQEEGEEFRHIIRTDLDSASPSNIFYYLQDDNTFAEIPRQHLGIIEGEVVYINRETGDLMPLEAENLFTERNVVIPVLVDNAVRFLNAALSE
jgi:hypothetical protein